MRVWFVLVLSVLLICGNKEPQALFSWDCACKILACAICKSKFFLEQDQKVHLSWNLKIKVLFVPLGLWLVFSIRVI